MILRMDFCITLKIFIYFFLHSTAHQIRVYWADWVSGKIERCDLMGADRMTFLETGHKIDYIVIDGGYLYYTAVGEA